MVGPYQTYDENSMGRFLCIYTSESEQNEGGNEDFVNEVAHGSKNDTQVEEVVDLQDRRRVGMELFDSVELFLQLRRKPEVLSEYHVGPPGVGKSFYLNRCLTVLPRFFDGVATAFVRLGRFRQFEAPPQPREILAMAQQISSNVKELVLFYDDFEVCYSKSWGPELTTSVYVEMDDPQDILVHVMGSQWLGYLLTKSLPRSRPLFIDEESRFDQYAGCSSFHDRCTPFSYRLHPCVSEVSFTKLFVSLFEEFGMFDSARQVGVMTEEDYLEARQSLYGMYWLTGGNARQVVRLALMLKKKKVSADDPRLRISTEDVVNFLTNYNYAKFSDQVFEIMKDFIGQLEKENDVPASVAELVDTNMLEKILAAGHTLDDLMKYNYWQLRGVPLDNFSSVRTDVLGLVDAGILVHDVENDVLFPGSPALLVWFAMCRNEMKKGEEHAQKEQLKKSATNFIGEIVKDVIKQSVLGKIQMLLCIVQHS